MRRLHNSKPAIAPHNINVRLPGSGTVATRKPRLRYSYKGMSLTTRLSARRPLPLLLNDPPRKPRKEE